MKKQGFKQMLSFLTLRNTIILLFFITIAASTSLLSSARKATPNLISSSISVFPEKDLEPGAIQSYSLTISNTGIVQANNVEARASITPNLQVLNVTDGKFDPDTNSAVWNLGSVSPNRSITVSFMGRLKTDSQVGESVNVEMYLSSKELREHKVESLSTKVKNLVKGPSAKLTAFQTVNPSNPQPGQEVMFHVIVTNEGQKPAENVVAIEQLPKELELLSDTIHPHLSNFARSTEPTSNFDLQNNTIKVKVDSLMPGEWVALMFSARVHEDVEVGKELAPKAMVKASNPEFQQVAPIQLSINPNAANVSVNVQADKNMVSAGDKVTFTITVSNSGDAQVTKLKIMNAIPKGLSLVTGSSTTSCGLKIVESAGQVLWKKGTLSAASNGNSSSCMVSYQATVNSGIADGTVITNTAVAKSQGINTSGKATTTVKNNMASTAGVDIMDNFFSPATLMVPAGTMITWSQKGNSIHTVTGAMCNAMSFNSDGQFPNGMRSGDKYSFMIPNEAKPGTMLYYFCRFHGAPGNCTSLGPGMAGVIIVK